MRAPFPTRNAETDDLKRLTERARLELAKGRLRKSANTGTKRSPDES